MPRTRRLFTALAMIGTLVAGVLTAAAPASAGVSDIGVLAAPAMQLPFPCGQTWNGNNSNSSAHVGWEIDFNRGGTATADLGDTVLAAAAGTVAIASFQTGNRYGNLVKIDHGGSYTSYYAHLSALAVKVGEYVDRGQVIGALGNTSAPGNNISPHLHFEVRYGTNYPNNTVKPVFNGSTFPYPSANVTSNNCATSYDPAEVCGAGFRVNDSARLAGQGNVVLLWNASTSNNCVVTLKFTNKGSATATAAYLEPSGATRTTDSGNYGYYAGPVKRSAPSCVKWGGSTGGASYNSPSEHC